MPLYTPFMEKSWRTISNARTERDQNRLYASAYMDEPGALEQLMQVNPQMARQLQQQKQQAGQLKLQQSAKKEANIRKLFTDNKEIIDQVVEDVAKFETYPEAQDYFNRKKEEYKPIFGDALNDVQLTEQMFNEAKTVYSDKQGDLSPAGRDFESLIANFTPEQQKNARLVKAGLKGRAMSNAMLSAIRSGEINSLADAKALIKKSEEEAKLTAQTKLKPNLEKQIKLSKDAGALSTAMFKQMSGVEQNIANLEEGLRLIDEGAAVGPVDKWFPSFKAASVEMENLKNRLGIDVIGQVTFGALSAGELQLALDTAIPPNLNPEELKKWFQKRVEPQRKLLAALEDGAMFLAEDGATIPKLMAKRRQEKNAQKQLSDEELIKKYGG